MTREMRKALKKRSHQILRSHYMILVIIGLIGIILGTTKTMSNPLELMKNNDPLTVDKQKDETLVTTGQEEGIFSVFFDILSNRVEEGDEKAQQTIDRYKQRTDEKSALGHTRGVLASMVNNVSSGSILVKLAQALRSITRSQVAVTTIFILGALLGYIVYHYFFVEIFRIVGVRMFIEAGTYERVPFSHVLSLLAMGKWVKAVWIIFVKNFYMFFWNLTAVGFIIKSYSYFMVEYIVAENPDLKANQAITLSRKMMNGHKWEAFKLDVTLVGWDLLSLMTYGISDIVYGTSYKMAVYAQYATYIRHEAIQKGIEGVEVLNDAFLYEKPEIEAVRRVYNDVAQKEAWVSEHKVELTGIRKFFSDWFGIWFGSAEEKLQYQEVENEEYSIRNDKMTLAGEAYPYRLNAFYQRRRHSQRGHTISFLRSYTIWTLLAIFLGFAMVGWLWEVMLTLISTGHFVNRGMLHGPWLPIYGQGIVLILVLGAVFRKKPVVEFVAATVMCGILEYYTAYYLWTHYHQKWWDYTGYFLNLHGRICAEGLLVFGVGGIVIVYLVAPLYDALLSWIKPKILMTCVVVLMGAFIADFAYSQKHPNAGKGVTSTGVKEARVEEAKPTSALDINHSNDQAYTMILEDGIVVSVCSQ